MMRMTTMLGLLAVASMAAAGCGDDDDGSEPVDAGVDAAPDPVPECRATVLDDYGLSDACAACVCDACPTTANDCRDEAGCNDLMICALETSCTFCPADTACLNDTCDLSSGVFLATRVNACVCDFCEEVCLGDRAVDAGVAPDGGTSDGG